MKVDNNLWADRMHPLPYIGRVSHSQQTHQDSRFEQALREARQVSTE